MRKWLSYSIDILLIAIIGVLGYIQISMLVTKDGNHGVPMAFGHSFLYVSTDSMDDTANNSIWSGCGIIVEKVSPESLRPSTPIRDENGTIIDYEKDGDVVTFYYAALRAPDTHRLIGVEYDSKTASYFFETMGDNPVAHQKKATEIWGQKDLIGKVVHHSQGLGNLLLIASPDAAASKGQTAWLLPTAVIGMIAIIAVITVVDVVKDSRKKKKEEEAELKEKLIAAGIDLEDEAAVEAFRIKEEIKQEYRDKLEEEREKALEEARKNREKELKKSQKANEKKKN